MGDREILELMQMMGYMAAMADECINSGDKEKAIALRGSIAATTDYIKHCLCCEGKADA